MIRSYKVFSKKVSTGSSEWQKKINGSFFDVDEIKDLLFGLLKIDITSRIDNLLLQEVMD